MWSRFMVLFIAASLTHSETLEKLRKVTESYGKLRKVMKIHRGFFASRSVFVRSFVKVNKSYEGVMKSYVSELVND